MENFIEIVQSVILPIVTLVLGYFGWRANADKNKLKAELKGLEHSNISKEIENQSSWIDFYKKLHDDQAERMTQMEGQIQQLKKTIKNLEHVFKKASSCTYYDTCPIWVELSKFENGVRKRSSTNSSTQRQRQSKNNIRDPTDHNSDVPSPTESEP